MKVFVTGATGFVGRHLLSALIAQGIHGQPCDIYCLVRSQKGLDQQLASRIHVLEGGLNEIDRYTDIIQSCDYIFHLAAKANFNAGGDYWQDNLEGTRHLLRAAQGSSHLQRFMFTSTIGAVDREPQDICESPLDENSKPNPLSPYGKSKLACEDIIAASQLPYTIIRPTWVYGPGMRADSHIRVFINMVLKRSLVSRFAFPGKVSVVHVQDLIQSLLLAAVDSRALRETFFVSDGSGLSIGEIFETIGELAGSPAGRIRIPQPAVWAAQKIRAMLPLSAQNLFIGVLWASPKKIETIGFKAKVPFRKGLLELMRWHRENEQPKADNGDRSLCVITGAASGIGRCFSTQLWLQGQDILLVDRDAQKLVTVGEELNSPYFIADIGVPEDLDRLQDFIANSPYKLGMLINNAGIGLRGKAADLGYEAQKKVLDVNCVALMSLSIFALEQFRKRGKGVLINIASSSAFQPLPYMATYAASKAFVMHFTEALWAEEKNEENIRIFAVCPSGTETHFQTSAGVKKNPKEKLLRPEDVAASILRAIPGKGATVMIGRSTWMMWMLSRILGRSMQAALWEKLMGGMR